MIDNFLAHTPAKQPAMQPVHALRPPAAIGVFCPSEPLFDNRLTKLEDSRIAAEKRGFRFHMSPHMFLQDDYMAGTPAQRCADIHELIQMDEIQALCAAMGGKSCNQLLHLLDFPLLGAARKPIISFSDGCVLLNAITACTGLVTFYGHNIIVMARWRHADLALLRDNTAFEQQTNLLGDTQSVLTRVLRPGLASGRLLGGDLATFVLGVAGLPFMPQWEDALFFCESSVISTQVFDQHLTCLRNQGFFEHIRGMIIGNVVIDDSIAEKRRDLFQTVLEILADYDFPIIVCATFGHVRDIENPLLPIGALCTLDAEAFALRLNEPIIAKHPEES